MRNIQQQVVFPTETSVGYYDFEASLEPQLVLQSEVPDGAAD